MNCYVRYIGVVDKDDRIHAVEFTRGLNIITGKSSTGKSAILEIFDYCLGSSEDTIPDGKLTERGKTFFTVLQFPTLTLVTGRTAASKRCFLREVTGREADKILEVMGRVEYFFDERYYIHKDQFLKSLGKFFGITMENIDKDPMYKQVTGAKGATPSVRSFPSFMLQHQNLVANKHAIFYRFDEKVKRDQAIEWLNTELRLSSYARESLGQESRDLRKEIKEIRLKLKSVQTSLKPFEEHDRRVAEASSLEDAPKKAKLLLEIAIDEFIENPPSDLKKMKEYWAEQVKKYQELLDKYDVDIELDRLSRDINKKMKEIGQRFHFEETYRKGSLRFDINTFDLWHEKEAHKKVFLRSMGSGANWVYSHLTLFMALHYQFAARGDKCAIPPILFLDQPTQVYFPSKDEGEEFEAENLRAEDTQGVELHDDIDAVSNMFTQMAKFCDDTAHETGVMPQIIVCDHADGLNLGQGYNFKDFVRAKWRHRGFIAD